jgi:RNA-binding protein
VEKLSSRQRAHLKSLAHPLKPIVQVGRDGVTATVISSVQDAFHTRELLKVKVLESAPDDPRAVADGLAAVIEDVHIVQLIGRTIVLYRRNPDRPEIILPLGT